MAELAGHIQVVREQHGRFRVVVDGQEFPWFIGERADVPVRGGEMPTVTITLLAEKVTVDQRGD